MLAPLSRAPTSTGPRRAAASAGLPQASLPAWGLPKEYGGRGRAGVGRGQMRLHERRIGSHRFCGHLQRRPAGDPHAGRSPACPGRKEWAGAGWEIWRKGWKRTNEASHHEEGLEAPNPVAQETIRRMVQLNAALIFLVALPLSSAWSYNAIVSSSYNSACSYW
jgi:hypothetical protein